MAQTAEEKRAYQRAWRKKNRAKVRKQGALREQLPPHLLPGSQGAAVHRANRAASNDELSYWRDLAMAQQGTIARLLNIIESAVELGG